MFMLVEQSRKVTWGQELMNRVWPVNTWFPTTQLDVEDHHTFYALCYVFFLAPYLIFFNLKNYLISLPWRVWTRYSFSRSSRRYDDKGDDDHRHHHPVNEIMKEWWTRLNVFVTNEIHFQEETRFPAHAAVVAARSTWLRTQLLRARERLQVRINFVFVFLYFSSSDKEQYDFLSSALFLHDRWNSFFL